MSMIMSVTMSTLVNKSNIYINNRNYYANISQQYNQLKYKNKYKK